MLSSHPRPKSQPPLKFKSMIVQANEPEDEDWNQIIDRYKEVDNNNQELEELSSSTLSSSSSSSLASSDISLSTNSSTSTVLAALNSLQHQTSVSASADCSQTNNKSMIARYSASAIGKKSHSSVRKTIQRQVVVGDGLEKSEEEEDDLNQALSSSSSSTSSSSSSSSSSGLSSMNSASNNSQEGLSLVSNQNQPQTMRCNNDNYCESDEIEVRYCLDQLIDSVSEQADNQIEYETFQLHEAILAQTTSGTSGSSSSSDGSGSPNELSVKHQQQQQLEFSTTGSKLEENGYYEHMDEVYIVRRFKIDEPLTEQLILHLSRQCISQVLKQQQHGAREDTWLAAISSKKHSIEWRQSRRDLIESVDIEKVIDCLVQRQLVVWLIDHKNGNSNSLEELETTLDDIALALDEPIGQINSDEAVNAKSSQVVAAQQIRFNNSNESNDDEIEAIVWLCKSEEKAIRFKEMFKSKETSDIARKVNKETSLSHQMTAHDRNNNDNNQNNDQEIDDRSINFAETTNDLVSANQLKLQQQAKAMKPLSDSNSSSSDRTKVSKGKVNVASAAATSNNHQQRQYHRQQIAVSENRQQQQQPQQQQQHVETPVSSLHTNNDQMRVAVSDQESLAKVSSTTKTINNLDSKTKLSKKKSSSGLDLSQQQQQQQQQASGLTSYYRNVANKVISNSQSKIRSFKDEMIKLNNRTSASATSASSNNLIPSYSASSSSPSSKRISLMVSHSDHSSMNLLNQRIDGTKLNSSSSVRNLALREQDSISKARNLSSPDNIDHQRRVSKSTSNLPLAVESTQNHGTKLVDHNQQAVPTVKPRTSILKNKQQQQQQQNNGCDNNNSSSHGKAMVQTVSKRQTFNSNNSNNNNNIQDDRIYGDFDKKRREIITNSTVTNKPKSILKSSKSVSNIVIEEQQSYLSPKYRQDESCELFEIEQSEMIDNAQTKQLLKSTYSKASRNELNDKISINQSKLNTSNKREQNENIDKRRSTYSMVGELASANKSLNNYYSGCYESDDKLNEYQEDIIKREQAFERLRQRASCYDISRLMSKNGLQSQLNKLRSGSTNSVTSKSRQRRPALLLDETNKKAEENEIVVVVNHHQHQQKSTKNFEKENDNKIRDMTDECENSRFAPGVKKTTSGPDGMVHAKVKDFQLKPIISNNDWTQQNHRSSVSSSLTSSQGGRRQQQQQQLRSSIVIKTSEQDSSSPQRSESRKSEFDPRSLKKLPVSSSYRSGGEIDTTDLPSKTNNKSSVTSVRVNGNTSCEEASRDVKQQNAKMVNNDIESEVKQEVKDNSSSVSSSNEESSTEDESPRPLTSSSLSKSGPFSLLRQSFNQKTLSSMLKFSGRASLRVKQPPSESNETSSDKSSAIAIAEANLLAAKQLKQQAQKLKEQQKREQQQQQQQQQHLDPSIMLAAVQYNQQIQRQQQHQIMYQQYAIASRGQMFDASSVHLQHQMLIQRQQQQQQQQQLAYMANLNSAHYMAQQMAVIPPQAPLLPMSAMAAAAQQLMYVQQTPVQQMQAQQLPTASSGLFRKSILKGSGNKSVPTPSAMMYHNHQQQHHQQQMIPMAVNHHSSFNIVYGASSAAAASQIPQAQHQHQIYEKEPQPQQQQQQQRESTLRKHSSLGASMRKTVKSILINRSSSKSLVNPNGSSQDNNNGAKVLSESKKPELKLKSALKSSNSRELVLNSEGSDGDGSSSDSTTVGSQLDTNNTTSKSQLSANVPKSALKKKPTLNHREILSSSSSDSSCSSANGNDYDNNNSNLNDGNTKLAKDYKQSVKLCGDGNDQFKKDSTLRASKRKVVGANTRKNVTFSAKLTSIL